MVHRTRDEGIRRSPWVVRASPAASVAWKGWPEIGENAVDPYGTLDPQANQPDPVHRLAEAGTFRVLVRGVRKRCPRCGERRIFDGFFTLKTRCPTCDLRFEKEEGGFLGAMALNYAVAIGFWLVVMIVGVALTVPVVPVAPLLAMSIGVLAAVPVWFYPRSKALWAAIEYLVARTEPGYRSPRPRRPSERELE
jgi:uncharacterized protein (DUF983 family)